MSRPKTQVSTRIIQIQGRNMKVSKKSLGMIEISEMMVKRDKARSAKLPRPEICFVNYMFI